MNPTVQTSESIGQRPVIASGAITSGWNDPDVSVSLADLTFIWSFVGGTDPAVVNVEVPSPRIVRFTITGKLPIGGTAWSLKEVGRFNGKPLQLAFTAAEFGPSEQPPHVSLRRLTYTFSLEQS